MSASKVIFLFALASLHIAAGLKLHGRKIVTCKPNISLGTHLLTKVIKGDLSLAAAFARGAFHDCITIRPGHKGSGCNGSLRLRKELNHRQNRRLDVLMRSIEPSIRKTCISYADAFQLGLQISLKLSGGPILHVGTGRTDATMPDPLDRELPGVDPFPVLKKFYRRKGFNVREMVVSDIAGHALGRFGPRQFTSEPNKFDNKFAVHVLRVSRGQDPLPDFHHLPSDIAMTHEDVLKWVELYADPKHGLKTLNIDFAKFLIKQSKLLAK